MSANNWSVCPQCKLNTETENAALIKKLDESYGVIPAKDYLELRTIATKEVVLRETLREDYGIWMNEDGTFFVDYECGCSVCGFGYKFNKSEKVKLKGGLSDGSR